MKKRRLIFGITALVILAVEVLIALFVRDKIIRPYFGDVLAVVFVYAAARVVFPKKPQFLSGLVFLFAAVVELVQLTNLSELFGKGSVISIIIGGTFDFVDILCYLMGGVICLAVDFVLKKRECE